MIREMTCIVCPMGCQLEVDIENGAVTSVKGNTCKRGEEYAKTECTNPQRTVTSTILCDNGELLPVKTDRTVNKEDIFLVMGVINNTVAHLPVKINDVIIKNVCGSNIVATKNMK